MPRGRPPGPATRAAGLGVLTVGLAPLFTLRKMLAMDIPSALRVME